MIKKRLIALLADAKKYIAFQVLFQWLGLLCQILMIFNLAKVLDEILGNALSMQDVRMALVKVGLAGILRFIFDRMATKMSHKASVDVKGTLRKHIYEKLLRLGSAYRETAATSNLVQSAVEGVDQLETYFGRYLPQLFYSLLAPLTLFAVLAPKNLKAATILLVFVPLIPMSIVVVQKIAKRLLSKYWGAYEDLGDHFLENLQGLTTLKIYEADAAKAKEMDAESEHFRKVTMKVLTMQLNSTSVMDIMAYGGAAVGMIIVLQQYALGALGFGDAMAFVLLAAEFFLPMRVLGSFFHIAMNGMAASDRIFAFLDAPEPEDGSLELGDEDDEPAASVTVTMNHVGFVYEEHQPVLQDISFSVPAGSFVSVVGESGSGKSTIAAILMGRNKHYEGSISYNGMELKNLREASIFRNVTYISHDSYLFKGSVRENLQLASPDATEEQLVDVLKRVNLWAFLQEQEGLDTVLQEAAGNLSGGQRQRLALARGLLHDSPMYILDEATSNIDPESEDQILKVLQSLKGKKTILFISHRLSNCRFADQIYYLEHGAMVESGTMEEMLQAPKFGELYEMQHALESYGGRETVVTLEGTSDLDEKLPRTAKDVTEEKHGGSMDETTGKRRPGIVIMGKLIGLVKPLLPIMLLAILLGVLGFGCAIFLTILASKQMVGIAYGESASLLWILVLMAVLRGLLHYGEQYCNHFIAFKLLAIIRHKVFRKLRALTPAKLEGRDRGDLISLITSDIELLEVFYAHTISPIVIALIMSLGMVIYIGTYSVFAAVIAAVAYVTVGVMIPLWIGQRGKEIGFTYRNQVGEMNSFVLESLRGLDETLQYGHGEERKTAIIEKSRALGQEQQKLNALEADQRSVTNLAIELFAYGLFFIMAFICAGAGSIFLEITLMSSVALMGSFGPVVALSNLSNNLNQTLASGERVLSLLEEEPKVREIKEGIAIGSEVKTGKHVPAVSVDQLSFSYGEEIILQDISLSISTGKIVGIHGASGSGKSTLLKLLMRFWEADQGKIDIYGNAIQKLNTSSLRTMESYMTQETYLFHDSIAANIRVGKRDATMEEVMAAAKKASIHDMICSLPKGYDTQVGELGSTLSGGERQRIGLARAFLHDAKLMLLDEPTSNLDALNEGIILKSIREELQEDKTVLIVSHRASTLHFADETLEMRSGRMS